MAPGLPVSLFYLLAETTQPATEAAQNSSHQQTLSTTVLYLILAAVLVFLNGFFVAAEFALVKLRVTQIDAMLREKRTFAKSAHWLATHMETSLSACQLGITMASLALGWVGEPAFYYIVEPMIAWTGLPVTMIHGISYAIAFTTITSLHVIIGEQAPKIFAIRRPEVMALWCAFPMWLFCIVTYPLLIVLSKATAALLRLVGMHGASDHESPHDEEEIRALIREAHLYGNLSRSENMLIDGVFEFDDMICRRVMVPRSDVAYLEISQTLDECIEHAVRTKHTRFPVCEGSLDEVIGIIHVKDLLGIRSQSEFDLRKLMRPAKRVPETLEISKLLRHFQATHQLMAIVVDEHGTVVGIASLENVLETIIGPVEDEFDSEPKEIVPEGNGSYVVLGFTAVDSVANTLGVDLEAENVDTFSGLLVETLGRIPEAGDQIRLPGLTAEVLEVRSSRAERIRVTLADSGDND